MIQETRNKFIGYREHVTARVKELEEKDINIKKLEKNEIANLKNLKIIEQYLSRSIDEHQKILSSHFDLKLLYSRELEDLSAMSLIKRFHFREEVYNKVLDEINVLENIELFLNPLFNKDIDKTYNLNKALETQRVIKKKENNDEAQIFEIDDNEWQKSMLEAWEQKRNKYIRCLHIIIHFAYKNKDKRISLSSLQKKLNETQMEELIPTVEIFKEVIVEFIKNEIIDIQELKKEEKEYICDNTMKFQLNIFSLEIIKNDDELKGIKRIRAEKLQDNENVVFENIKSEIGTIKRVKCSDVIFIVE